MDNKKVEISMQTLIDECGSKNPPVHTGKITQVAKTTDYDKTKQRLFLIDLGNDITALMKEVDAPEDVKKAKSSADIIGRTIRVIAKQYFGSLDQIYVSEPKKKTAIDYSKFIKNKKILSGTIDEIGYGVIYVNHMGNRITINQEDYHYYYVKIMPYMVGKKINFRIKEVKDGVVYGTRKEFLEDDRDKLIEEIKDGKVIEATVIEACKWGLRLGYHGHPLLLRNKDFAIDHTKADKVYKIGDKLRVKVCEITPSKRIHVQPETKYFCEEVDISKYSPGDAILGEVVTVTTSGVFVNIEPGMDVLCPIPNPLYMREPEINDSVMVKISKVDVENHKMRGRIASYVKEDISLASEENKEGE